MPERQSVSQARETLDAKFERIDDAVREFIEAQKVFFVAAAAREGRVDVAAKGMDTLRVVGPHRIVWLNLTGSENEAATQSSSRRE